LATLTTPDPLRAGNAAKPQVPAAAWRLLKIQERESVKPLLVSVILLTGAVAACYAPSVPVPPPGPESMTFTLEAETGMARYQANLGTDWANAWVTVYDDTSGKGVIDRSDATGHVGPTTPWQAHEGDQVRIQFDRDDGPESGVCLILHNGPSSTSYECTH
jgi:hypothetical protein